MKLTTTQKDEAEPAGSAAVNEEIVLDCEVNVACFTLFRGQVFIHLLGISRFPRKPRFPKQATP